MLTVSRQNRSAVTQGHGPLSTFRVLPQYVLGGARVSVRVESIRAEGFTDRGYSQERAADPVLRKHALLGQEDIMREKRLKKMMKKTNRAEERISNSIFDVLKDLMICSLMGERDITHNPLNVIEQNQGWVVGERKK